MNQAINFSADTRNFFVTLNQRVNEYFKVHNINKKSNLSMVFKTIAILSIYFIPYIFIVTSGESLSIGLYYILCSIMGIGMAGIGMSIMHDANHGAYSKKTWVNNVLGYSLSAMGGNVFNWKMQHNVLHHTFTNIEGVDEDITPRGILRFSPHTNWKPIHRYQHIYAWFLYGLLTMTWVFFKDFDRMAKYQKSGFMKKQKLAEWKTWLELIFVKIVYTFCMLVIPLLVLPFAWPYIVGGFLLMHYISGIILANIFQLAHVVENAAYPLPDKKGNMKNAWAIHQLYTTINFAQNNRILSWYVGGLNFQVEHHLFSNICHIHYKKIAPIIQKTAEEFGLPYHANPTFTDALIGHYRHLKDLSKQDVTLPSALVA